MEPARRRMVPHNSILASVAFSRTRGARLPGSWSRFPGSGSPDCLAPGHVVIGRRGRVRSYRWCCAVAAGAVAAGGCRRSEVAGWCRVRRHGVRERRKPWDAFEKAAGAVGRPRPAAGGVGLHEAAGDVKVPQDAAVGARDAHESHVLAKGASHGPPGPQMGPHAGRAHMATDARESPETAPVAKQGGTARRHAGATSRARARHGPTVTGPYAERWGALASRVRSSVRG